jgi:hypothetical protein
VRVKGKGRVIYVVVKAILIVRVRQQNTAERHKRLELD